MRSIKERTRIQAIKKHGYRPIRVMFYYPNREKLLGFKTHSKPHILV